MTTQIAKDRIVRIAELTEIFGASKATVWRMRQRGELPEPLRISAGIVGWKLSVINALLDKWEREAANGGDDADA